MRPGRVGPPRRGDAGPPSRLARGRPPARGAATACRAAATGASGHVAALEQQECEQQGRSTIQHAVAQRRQHIADPRE